MTAVMQRYDRGHFFYLREFFNILNRSGKIPKQESPEGGTEYRKAVQSAGKLTGN